MKIAVASNDGISVSEHFGRTSRFTVFVVENNQIMREELRCDICTAGADGDCDAQHAFHNQLCDYTKMIAALEDCRVVLCRGMGWRAASQLVRSGINPLVIRGEISPREAVLQYLAGTLQPSDGFCRCQK